MKLTKLAYLLTTLMSATVLTACGGGGSDSNGGGSAGGGYPEPTPTPTPAPAVEFPVQQATPEIFTLDDTGSMLTAENGLSLYFFANDAVGTSNCNGVEGDSAGSTEDASSCAGTWPPLLAADDAVETSNYTLVERSDGTMQWSYKGSPLYTFGGDSAQGDINGDGVDGIWDLARPTPLKVAALNDINTYMGNQTIATGTLVGAEFEKSRANKDGFTLYTFDNDALNGSACISQSCLDAWPPLLADNAAKPSGMLSLIDRAEGDKQWAYKGKALYFFAGDSAAGQNNGDNVGNVWHTADQLPAIQRSNDAGTQLTATGSVTVLLPNAENNDALEATTADRDQFTLYTFDNDEADTSNCNDTCAVNWPPFLASDTEQAVGDFTKITRADGNMQWALEQQPLYFFAGDSAKAQNNGDGVGGVWHIVEPTPVAPAVTTSIVASDTSLGESLTSAGEANVLADDGNGGFAPVVMDKTGFQLYIFDNDSAEQSNCTSAGCMETWPALLASDTDEAVAPFSIFTRDDGHQQWAVNGMPLYFFAGDSAAAEQLGEGVGDIWWVARPAPVITFELSSNGETVLGFIGHGNVLASQGKTAAELTDLTLYTFDDDVVGSGESTCFSSCATTWPPLYASSADQAFGEFEIINRTETDNSQTLQWTYKGQPLYFVAFDSVKGDTNGVYGTWHIALP